jgi:hypothetical protein
MSVELRPAAANARAHASWKPLPGSAAASAVTAASASWRQPVGAQAGSPYMMSAACACRSVAVTRLMSFSAGSPAQTSVT